MLDSSAWVPGSTFLFDQYSTDSVIGLDSSYQIRDRKSIVSFHIVDTTGGATIEWIEYMSVQDDMEDHGVSADAGWFPFMRLVYRCDQNGALEHLLNYPELKANTDSLTTLYIDSSPLTEEQRADPTYQRMVQQLLDSAVMTDRLMQVPKLLHLFHGYQAFSGSGLDSIQMTFHGIDLTLHLEALDSDLCGENATPLFAWMTGQLSDMEEREEFSPWSAIPMIDSLLSTAGPLHVKVHSCFDHGIGLPFSSEIRFAMDLGDNRFVQNRRIFLRPQGD